MFFRRNRGAQVRRDSRTLLRGYRPLLEQLEDLGSPIGAFVRECCDVGAAYSIAVDTLFLAWREWCTEQGRDRPGTKSSFGRDLKAAHPELNVTQPREEGRQLRRHYQGVRLKPETAVDDNADPV